jgi:hypothetical protein
MDQRKQCDACDEIAAQMRAAIHKLIGRRVTGGVASREDLVQYLTSLFASEPHLDRLNEVWNQSGFGAARHRWMEHRMATGHVPLPISQFN